MMILFGVGRYMLSLLCNRTRRSPSPRLYVTKIICKYTHSPTARPFQQSVVVQFVHMDRAMSEKSPRTRTAVSGSENLVSLDVSSAVLRSSSSTFHTSWLSGVLEPALDDETVTGASVFHFAGPQKYFTCESKRKLG